MNKYEVTIQAVVTKTLLIEAKDSNSAEEAAHEQFSVLNEGPDEQYDQRTLDVTQISPSYYIAVREDHHVEYEIKASSEDEARDLINMGKQTPIDRLIDDWNIIELKEIKA
tara:strand:- start:5755 stop:6087 length:333 start_codon:yes stop_codon:yes gene_type:complete